MSEQRPSTPDWGRWEALAREMEREEESLEQQDPQTAEPPNDSSREGPASTSEEVCASTAGQSQDTSNRAVDSTLEPETDSDPRRNEMSSVADHRDSHALSDAADESTGENPQSDILNSPAPVSPQRMANVSPTRPHHEAAARPVADHLSGNPDNPLTSLGPFPEPPSLREGRYNQATPIDSATSSQARQSLYETWRCGCIEIEYGGNRRWRLCESPMCETRNLRLWQATGSFSQSTAHNPSSIDSPDGSNFDEQHDDAITDAPSSLANSAAPTEQAASPSRRLSLTASDDASSDPGSTSFAGFSDGMSSDPEYPDVHPDLVPTAVPSSSDSDAVTPLPRVQVNDTSFDLPSLTATGSASGAEPLLDLDLDLDLEQHPWSDSRAVVNLPRVELYDPPVPDSPPEEESPQGGVPLQAQDTSSHDRILEVGSIPIDTSHSVTQSIVDSEDPDAITPAPPLSPGHKAPPVPPAGATPAPTEEQAPFLVVEDAVHRAPRPSRPQIAPFTSKQIQEANASLAAVTAVATASATNPSSVFNTPLLGAPASSSTLPSTQLNTPMTTTTHPSSSVNSAPTTASLEWKPPGWGGFEGPSSLPGPSGSENTPPVQIPLLPILAPTPSPTPVEPHFPDYGGVDVGSDLGPMTRFTSGGDRQVVAADAAGYVRTEPQSYPRAMERAAVRETIAGGGEGGGGAGGDGAGDAVDAGNADPPGHVDGAEDAGPSTRRPPSRRQRVVRKVNGAFGGMRDVVRGCFERERDPRRDRNWEGDEDEDEEEEMRPRRGRSRERGWGRMI